MDIMSTQKILNVLNGTCTKAPQNGGENCCWLENYLLGQVPGHRDWGEFLPVRAGELSRFSGESVTQVSEKLAACREQVLQAAADEEYKIYLYNDGCVFDQLLYIMVIRELFEFDELAARIYMVNKNGTPEELSDDDLEIGATAAGAFTGQDPRGMLVFIMAHNGMLNKYPFLTAAFKRLLQELPDGKSGLGYSQEQVLRQLEKSAETFGGLHKKMQTLGDMEHFTDLELKKTLAELAETVTEADGKYMLTESGKQVLSGKKDFLSLPGGRVRYVGGVKIEPGKRNFKRRMFKNNLEVFEG